jgi:hypothetical protein
VRFNVLPKNVEVLVDDQPIPGRFWHPGEPIVVGPGPHRIELKNPSCFPETVRLPDGAVAIPGVIRLKWIEGRLNVITSPEGAEVVVRPEHGKEVPTRGGREVTIRIPPEQESPREVVRVSARADGYRSSEAVKVVVEASKLTTVRLDLARIAGGAE